MKKSWMILVVFMIFLASLISCSFKFLQEEERPKVVVVLKSLNIEYWKIFKSGAEKAFDDFQIDGKVIAPASMYLIKDQMNMLKDVLKQNPDALIVAPTHPSATIPILIEYNEKNIPVLLADTDAGWEEQTSYIGTDNTALGKMAGKLLASMLQPGDQAALISGAVVDTLKTERIEGAKKTLEAAGIKVVTEQSGYDQFGNAKSVMANILEDYPEVKGVFAADDTMALEALKIIEEKELKIPVIGTDGITKMIEYIEKGALSATLAQNPYDMGYLSVKQALNAIKGENVLNRIDSGVDIITQDNARDKLDFLEKLLD
ncbi:sugar ABC transporter substrate-binding protein [Bacillus taeanensis]|uniref:Sugar ABC transporter substrate-binding protein n=1 Tax=Bacillus taeanensis TaxID=273032 RepID=A0A366XZV5_9BACI|nr:sugar ABC transporter substrate-binding protein [Bacillus taeanensis]RBW69683.1 sugar ABC transporter substrate-binding protein [Bacillus taeanensis]